mgnify:FL=1
MTKQISTAGPITVGISSALCQNFNRLSPETVKDVIVYGVGISSESITSWELTNITNTTFSVRVNDVDEYTYNYPAVYASKLYPLYDTYYNWGTHFPEIFEDMANKCKNKNQLRWWDLDHRKSIIERL